MHIILLVSFHIAVSSKNNVMTSLLYFCSDYQIGLTQAQTSTLVEICKHKDVLNIIPISSQNEQERGLFDTLLQHQIVPYVIKDLDEHKDFKRKVRDISQIIKDQRIEVVNVQNNWQLAIIAYIKHIIRPRPFKVIYTIHGYRHNSFFKSIPAIAIIGISLLLFTNRVISMSSYVSKRFWFVRYKTDLVFYMMTQPSFNKTKNIINTSPLRLIFPAQFRKGKNQMIIIKAIEEYIKETGDNEIRCDLPGSGELLDEYKSYVNNHNLNQNITFPGKLSLDDVIERTNQSNVAVISSNVETYGRCITEPFCLGRCVVTRSTGIAQDIIHHGENGFLYNSSNDLKKILILLHQQPSLISSCAKQAFIDKKIFHPNTVFHKYLESIEKCTKQKRQI